jgi:hypothetical protein
VDPGASNAQPAKLNALFYLMRVLPGLHKGKTAVITGGSLGIGLQLGRFLAIAAVACF